MLKLIEKYFTPGRPSGDQIVPDWYVGTRGTSRSSKEHLSTYAEAGWIFGPFTRIAEAVAEVPWTMYRPPAGEKRPPRATQRSVTQLLRDKRILEVGHVFLDILEDGNPVLDGISCLQVMALTYLLDGEMAAILERDEQGNLLHYYPIPTHWISQLPSAERPFFDIMFPQDPIAVPAEDVWFHKRPNPLDPYGRGVGAAQVLSGDLDADAFAQQHVQNYFRNNSTPSLLIGVENATQDQLNRARAAWEASNRGIFRGFGTHFYSGKLNAQQLSRSFRENQTLDLREFNRDTVMQTLGMPPEIQGILENANRSTIDVAYYLFSTNVLLPVLNAFRASGQKIVRREYGSRYLFDYVDPRPENYNHKLQVMKAAPQAVTVNEWRAAADLPPVDGGEEMYVPIEYTSDLERDNDANEAD